MTIGFFFDDSAARLGIRLAKVTLGRLFLSLLVGLYATQRLGFLVPVPALPQYAPFTWLADLILAVVQLGLILGLARLAVVRLAPDFARRWRLDWAPTHPASGEIDGRRLAKSWISVPLKLSAIMIVTFAAIPWLFLAGGPLGDVPLEFYALHSPVGLTAAGVGAFLALCGWGWGAGFTSSAKARVGNVFGVQYLSDDHPLTKRVAVMAGRLGLSPPSVGVTGVTNAFAMGTSSSNASVVLGTPLIKTFPADELDAIIAHELGHIVSNDMVRMQYASGFQGMLNAGSANAHQYAVSRARTRDGAILAWVVGTLFRQVLFLSTKMAVMGLSRRREFLADAVGAALTTPDTMANALRRIHGAAVTPTRLEQQYGFLMFRSSRLGVLMSTHPTLDKRLGALEKGHHIKTLPRKMPLN
jgi:heat shock protein HtpX